MSGWTYTPPATSSTESSPIVGPDGTIYYGSNDGKFYAVSASGSLKWSWTGTSPIKSTAVMLQNGNLVFGTDGNKVIELSKTGSLVRPGFNKTTGSFRSSPNIAFDSTIFIGNTDTYMYALTKTLSLKWRFKTSGNITSSPAIDPVQTKSTMQVCVWHALGQR